MYTTCRGTQSMSNIHHLHPQSKVISQFVRFGHSSYRSLEGLYSAGRIPVSHAVLDANQLGRQSDLKHTLYDGGVQIILDTKSAELATNGGASSSARDLPWATPYEIQTIDDWEGSNGEERADQIAEFAVQYNVDAVLSPSHFIDEIDSPWFTADTKIVRNLRNSLNQAGASHIRIDHHLTIPVSLLRDYSQIKRIGEVLADLPIDNIWLRVSGYGMRGTPTATKKYIEAAWLLESFNKPIVADNVGGACGLSLAAFGAVGGISQGLAEKESFSINNWRKVNNGHGGSARRLYLPQLDLFLTQAKAEIFLKGRGAKRFGLCNDPNCCHSLDDMIMNHKAHALVQSNKQILKLNGVPELKRADYLLNDFLRELERTLRKVKNMNFNDSSLTKRLQEHTDKTTLLFDVLDNLNGKNDYIPVAKNTINTMRPMKKVI